MGALTEFRAEARAWVEQNLPPRLQGRRYYQPSDQGYEREVAERIRRWWGDRKG